MEGSHLSFKKMDTVTRATFYVFFLAIGYIVLTNTIGGYLPSSITLMSEREMLCRTDNVTMKNVFKELQRDSNIFLRVNTITRHVQCQKGMRNTSALLFEYESYYYLNTSSTDLKDEFERLSNNKVPYKAWHFPEYKNLYGGCPIRDNGFTLDINCISLLPQCQSLSDPFCNDSFFVFLNILIYQTFIIVLDLEIVVILMAGMRQLRERFNFL